MCFCLMVLPSDRNIIIIIIINYYANLCVHIMLIYACISSKVEKIWVRDYILASIFQDGGNPFPVTTFCRLPDSFTSSSKQHD